MRRTLVLGVPCVLLSIMTGPVPAQAGAAQPVSIDADSSFAGSSTFTASGGGLCASGTAADAGSRVTGSDHATAFTFHLVKTFTCADGSGSFSLRIQASVRPCDPTEAGAWAVVGGTGRYVGLRGAGTLVGDYYPTDACDAVGVVDHLSGMMVAR
jgi:hypothetical protein